MIGASHALNYMIPLHVMCDPNDIHVYPQVKAAHNEKPTIFIYDSYPGGIGLSDKVYENSEVILLETISMIENCACESGCPSCIGTESATKTAKSDAKRLLGQFCKQKHE
jgi:DEAD/DEAH box helicase domain-containing protein